MALTKDTIKNYKVSTSKPFYHFRITDRTEVKDGDTVIASQDDTHEVKCGDWQEMQDRGILQTAQNAWPDEVIQAYNEHEGTTAPTYSEFSS